MNEPTERFKRAPSRRAKTPPVKRITVSPEVAEAYAKLAQERDEKQRDYARHLGPDNKPR